MIKAQTIARLPRAYAPFAALFGQMDAPMMSVLGGILSALSDRLEMVGTFQNQPDGDFVGYDGLENRGKLANLLETEWLLRELDADDFVRRVAEGEVLFRRRDFQNTGKQNTLAVILDCGPWMLGRNRLIGLAALFYLALRAERTGAELCWIVPDGATGSERRWNNGLNRESVHRYLGQIVQSKLTATDIDAALAGLQVQGRLDCWYVGSHQTATMAEHPDIGSSLLVRTRYGAQSANLVEIEVSSARRKLTKVDVTFESDDICVAALRRPFKPEVHKRTSRLSVPTHKGVLSSMPFNTRWMLDRFSQAVLIRMHEGVLWQPLIPGTKTQGVWLPLRKGDFLLGVQADRDQSLSAMIGHRHENSSISGPQPCDVTLLKIDLGTSEAPTQCLASGMVSVNPAQFPDDALGNLHLQPNCSVVQSNGTRIQFKITSERVLQTPTRADARVLFVDASYRVEMREQPGTHVRVKSVSRGTQMLLEPLSKRFTEVSKQPRRILFSPTSKLLSITFDDRSHMIYGHGDPYEIEMPDGLSLIHLESRHRGLAWNAEDSDLIQVAFRNDAVKKKLLKKHQWPTLSLPRYCPLTSTVFTIRSDEDGNLLHFVPIHTKRGWQDVNAVDLVAAVEKARTVWLEN